MKVLMLSEYFSPFDFGGSEWSTYYLAKGLAQMGYNVSILTPNYGISPKNEQTDEFRIVRFPFYKKVRNNRQLTPFWQNNLLWWLWTSFFLLKFCLKNKVDIIHVQGKYFLPSAIFCKFILRKKIVITLREYISLCPLGMCFLRGDKACNLFEYLSKDWKEYRKLYKLEGSLSLPVIQLLIFLRSRIISYFLKFLLNFVDQKIAISNLQKTIYTRSGVKNILVIDNPFLQEGNRNFTKRNKIIFAGRLTPGKGPDILVKAAPKILTKYPKMTFVLYGDGFLKPELIKLAQSLKITKNVKFAGRISHEKLISALSSAKLSVIPSVWPEPFGRIALESLFVSTPPVVSNRAGIADHIKNGKWGMVVDPTVEKVSRGILYALAHYSKILKNVQKDKPIIEKTWGQDILDAYSKTYKNVLK